MKFAHQSATIRQHGKGMIILETALETAGLTYVFPDGNGIKNIAFQVKRREIYALYGGHHAGKSVLLQTIIGTLRPQAGTLKLFGNIDYQKERRRIGFVPQKPVTIGSLSPADMLRYFSSVFGTTEIHILDKITKEYVQKLLNLVDIKEYRAVMAKIGSTKLLIFSIKQPNRVVTLLGVMLENCEISTDNGICTLKSANQIVPIYIDRIDKQYLMTRSNEIKNLLSGKKVLLIGCGSVGGYIANELVKAGIEKMMLVDADFLYEINIFRHLLGLEYVGQYKCVAVQHYLEKNIPNLQLTSLTEEIEEAIQEGEVEFEKYDVIISATGNHNINRWINKYIYERKIGVPVIYAWNEALGIGNHVAYFQYGNAGCYECLFRRDEDNEELYDRTSYCEHGQDVVQKVAGCGSAFIPYGSTVSIKTAAMCVDTVKKIFEGRYSDNTIISAKGDDYHLKRAGLKVSTKYLNQKDCIVEYRGNLLANPDCEICGEKNGN